MTTADDRCRLFFRLVFDDFEFSDFSDDRCTKSLFGKKSRARCFGKAFWGHPGASWGVREGILGAPGVSRGHFGRALGGLGAILERLFEQSDFKSIF